MMFAKSMNSASRRRLQKAVAISGVKPPSSIAWPTGLPSRRARSRPKSSRSEKAGLYLPCSANTAVTCSSNAALSGVSTLKPLVAADQVREGPKYVIEAERVNRADVEIDVIAGLDVMAKPRLDLVHGGVGVSDASDGARCIPHGVDGSRELGNDDAGLSAA